MYLFSNSLSLALETEEVEEAERIQVALMVDHTSEVELFRG